LIGKIVIRLHAQKFKAMGLDFKEIFTVGMILFAVIDIPGSIPIIIDLRKKVGHIQSEKASIVAGILMVVFLFVGEEILKLIGIDVGSFAVAGAFILFFLAIEMILGVQLYKDDAPETAAIVPFLSLKAEYETPNIIVAIIVNIIVVYAVLKSSKQIERVLGKQGISVIRKIFGVILLAIAVKLFATNITRII